MSKRKTKAFYFLLASGAFFVLFQGILFYKLVQIFGVEHSTLARVYAIVTTLFLLSRPVIALFYRDEHTQAGTTSSRMPLVSIIIAGKNEVNSIYRTIETCMRVAYRGPIECIVIDDGSTDGTFDEIQRASRELSTSSRIIVAERFEINQGKREGMHHGINIAQGEFYVFVDSDSFLAVDAIDHIIDHFDNPRVGAVSGNTGVHNAGDNALTKMQSARYSISFDIFKACESVFGAVTCCPGCFSAYRASTVHEVVNLWKERTVFGQKGTFGDDRSLTNFVLQKGYRVEYCRSAHATTIVPHTYKQFIKQQLRWKKSWVREGMLGASTFMWKQHPLAAFGFYINLVMPFVSPVIVFLGLVLNIIHLNFVAALIFTLSIILMSVAYSLFNYTQNHNKHLWYAVPFTLLYSVFMVWQMPWAILRITDTGWGTR